MPKQVQMWEAADGDLFDSEEEALVHEALENLKGLHRHLTDDEIDLLDRIIEDEDFRNAFVAYTLAKKAAEKVEQERNKQNPEVTRILKGADGTNSSS